MRYLKGLSGLGPRYGASRTNGWEIPGTNRDSEPSVSQSGIGVVMKPRTCSTNLERHLGLGRVFRTVAWIVLLLASAPAQVPDAPPGFEHIESAFLTFLLAHSLPGASLAIARNGRLILARGYGLADVDLDLPVQPASTFRIGSVTKTITSIAVMKLVEAGKLDLDTPAFALIPDIRPTSGRLGDARISRITIRNLLTHSGGWDASISGEPVVAPQISQIAAETGGQFPPSPEAIISWVLNRPLDFDPGTRFAYSNFGFVVLGRVIEKVAGQPYDEFVQREILSPMGIQDMRPGRTILALRAPREVHYYDYPGAPLVNSLMPSVSGPVPEPYSGILPFESIDSAGAWIASSIDLARIFVMLDGQRPPAVLSPASIQQMVTPTLGVLGISPAGNPASYGLGLGIELTGADAEWWGDGGTWGTQAVVARLRNGWVWSAVFNSAPKDTLYTSSGAPNFVASLQSVFSVEALESVSWPDVDLFPRYLGTPATPRLRR
ncbi:MAG TPA: serine hydrolase domain-containing protein [Bryobacteraceae bacterium]|nr:serine hydrolase domain-containing protein [Bryobacteraceae bacterium]